MRSCFAGLACCATLLVACGASPFGLSPPGDGGLARDAGTSNYHPQDFALRGNHGPALKRQTEDCRTCHGNDLTGGRVNVSCDGCHPRDWRSRCTFCHGGGANDTGAPPRGLFGNDTPSFPAHTAHVTDTLLHTKFDCTTCHKKPTDVLSVDHIFDGTQGGQVELDFSGGLATAATFGNGQCSNNYCHGNGRTNGTARADATNLGCGGCHPATPTTGRHGKHAREAVPCSGCHSTVVAADGRSILDPALHVNGTKEVAITTEGFTYSGGRCSGTCHRVSHRSETW